MNSADDLISDNPYAPPQTNSGAAVETASTGIDRWLQRLIVLQCLVIIVCLVIEAGDHASIVWTGPVFATVGFAILITALCKQDRPVALFGASAVLLTMLIVFLINYLGWGPAQGDAPISAMAYAYTGAALPTAAWLVVGRSAGSRHQALATDAE